MEQELRFGLDLGWLEKLKNKILADYKQFFRVLFSCFQAQKKREKRIENIVAPALKSCIR